MEQSPITPYQELVKRREEILRNMSEDERDSIKRKRRATCWRQFFIWSALIVAGVFIQLVYNVFLADHLPADTKLRYIGWAIAIVAPLGVVGSMVGLIWPDLLVSEAATKRAVEGRPDLKRASDNHIGRMGLLLVPVLLAYFIVAIWLTHP